MMQVDAVELVTNKPGAYSTTGQKDGCVLLYKLDNLY